MKSAEYMQGRAEPQARVFAAMAAQFPPLDHARPDGLLCMGGDLTPQRLLVAYSMGIFPWYEEGLPILWWSPDPRCILPLEDFHLPKRSVRSIRHAGFTLSLDKAFSAVIRACAGPRKGHKGTWIIPEMIAAYEALHALGYAHSVEVWQHGELAGGLYGVALGRAFFGESMFYRVSEASRAALAGLVQLLRQRGALLLDCQQETPHMMAMGGILVPRATFMAKLASALSSAPDCPHHSRIYSSAPRSHMSDGLAGHGGEELRQGPWRQPRSAAPWLPWQERYDYSSSRGSWIARS